MLAIVIWTIITVELTLSYNSVNGVYSIQSTAQLIPFIIGIFSIGKTVNSIMVRSIKEASFPMIVMPRDRAHISSCVLAVSQLAQDYYCNKCAQQGCYPGPGRI